MSDGRKKVAWLYSHLLFQNGGTRFIFEVARRLQRSYDVTVIVDKAAVEIKEEFTACGLKVEEVGVLTSNSLLYWLFFPLVLKLDEYRIRRKVKDVDVVIAGIFPMNVIAARLNRPFIQNCWEPYAFFYDSYMVMALPLYKRIFLKILSTLYSRWDFDAARKSKVITTLNLSTGRLIKDIYGKTALKTYMGVDTDFFKPKLTNLRKDASNKVILHSTDYTETKGTRYLIEALPLIAERVEKIKLIVTQTVENPKEKECLLKTAKKLGVTDCIEFVGTIPYSKLTDYYLMADIVVFTGHPETVGATASLTVLEAMACEKPVVRSIGCDEEVEDGVSGILVDPRDMVKLADAVVRLLLDEGLAKSMGKEGRKRVKELYNWSATSEKFYEVIEALNDGEVRGKELTA